MRRWGGGGGDLTAHNALKRESIKDCVPREAESVLPGFWSRKPWPYELQLLDSSPAAFDIACRKQQHAVNQPVAGSAPCLSGLVTIQQPAYRKTDAAA